MTKKVLYFLCTGNSCRSQMADGWAKKLLQGDLAMELDSDRLRSLGIKTVQIYKGFGMLPSYLSRK